MLGATLRVKSRVADLCRANSAVSTLVLDINDWFIDEMFWTTSRHIELLTEFRCQNPHNVQTPGWPRLQSARGLTPSSVNTSLV
jgi:hypothetical protein